MLAMVLPWPMLTVLPAQSTSPLVPLVRTVIVVVRASWHASLKMVVSEPCQQTEPAQQDM